MTHPQSPEWKWDESLFEGAAPFYERGRLPYSPALSQAFHDALGLDGGGRLLDIGCGPGTITLRLAQLFEEVVGLDPDHGMVVEAGRLANERGVKNATWVQLRAEALPADLGTFRTITFAASFHWLDRPLVAATVKTMLEPEGAVVQVDAPGYRPDELHAETARADLPYPPPPDHEIDELRNAYLGPGLRAGRGVRISSPGGENEVFEAAGFAPGRRVIVPDGRVVERTPDQIVAGRFSSSSSAPHLFGDRLGDFETDLRNLLAEASPSGRFAVRLPDNVLTIWTRRK
jgi:SAM-dependent methyltransferase